MTYEWRVVWQREGCDQRRKLFQREHAARRRFLFLGPEPWLASGRNPDERWCCSGSGMDGCPCGGLTVREHEAEVVKELPALIYVRMERREVKDWEPLTERVGAPTP